MIVSIILGIVLLPLMVAGALTKLQDGALAERGAPKQRRAPRRSLANDGQFMDGMITGVALDELSEMFD